MTSSRRGPLIAAFVVTVLLAWLAGRDQLTAQVVAGLVSWLAVPALWAAAVLAGGDRRWLAALAPTAVVAALALAGWLQAGVLASLILAGLVGGWTLRRRWRVVPILALVAMALIPSVMLPLGGTSYPDAAAEQLGLWREQYMERMPADLSPADRKTALAAFDEVGERSLSTAERFWPSMVLAGLMSQTAIFLLAGWGLARLAVAAPPRPRLTPLASWRAPFATVWVLIGGLVLVLLTATGLAGLVGWNLVVLAATLLIIQGLGVQTWLVARVLPRTGQVVFWVLGALFLAPAMIGGGALIGLADQWMDLRRLRRPPDSDDET